jgi:hypothetical protein
MNTKMVNYIPTMKSVIEYSKPLYIVQLLTIVALDGAKFYVLYIQDMNTIHIVHHETFECPVKSGNAALSIFNFLNSLIEVNHQDIIFVMLKTTPFANKNFISVMSAFNVKSSYFSRKEVLEIYQAHKLTIKYLITKNPDKATQIIESWNKLPTNRLTSAKLASKTTISNV